MCARMHHSHDHHYTTHTPHTWCSSSSSSEYGTRSCGFSRLATSAAFIDTNLGLRRGKGAAVAVATAAAGAETVVPISSPSR